MLTFAQAATLGLLQGVTELFPISSLGHSVILPSLLHWNINQSDPNFLPFLVLTHVATALVLFFYFWREWLSIIVGVLRSLVRRNLDDRFARIGWLLIVGTIPAGIVGLLFQNALASLFANAKAAAVFLALNGLLLAGAELLRRRRDIGTRVSRLSWLQAAGIGFAQCVALLPGFSRTGSTLGGGLLVGLSHEDAARFSFLLATPIIFAAAAVKVPHILAAPQSTLLPALLGALCAAVAAFLSIRFLINYFKTKTLWPFAIYCLLAGTIAFFLL